MNDSTEFEKGYGFAENEVWEYLMPTLYPVEKNGGNEAYYLLGKYAETEVKELLLAGKKVKTHR